VTRKKAVILALVGFVGLVALGALWVGFRPGRGDPETTETPTPPETPGPAGPFTVATYNINWGNPDLAGVVRAIRETGADLVCLQETNAESAAFIRARLGQEYPHALFRGPEGVYAAAGFGFLSRAPLEKLRFVEARHGLFRAWLVETKLGGREVQLAGVHLMPLAARSESLAEVWRAFGEMEEIHAKEIRLIWEGLDRERPVIVLGDLNSSAHLAAPKFLAARGLVASFAAVTKNPDSHITWRWPVGRGEIKLRIDYIFHSPELRTLKSRIIASAASDHRPVVSRLEWVGAGAGGE